MKMLILGHGRHGKDTVAEIIKNKYGLTFTSSSAAALAAIWPCLKEARGYTDKDSAFGERLNDRMLWKELITLYNTPNRSALCMKILEDNDIYVGMRCAKEYEASRHLFDLILWIDASKRVDYVDKSLTISFDPNVMMLVDNNGENPDISGLHQFIEGFR